VEYSVTRLFFFSNLKILNFKENNARCRTGFWAKVRERDNDKTYVLLKFTFSVIID